MYLKRERIRSNFKRKILYTILFIIIQFIFSITYVFILYLISARLVVTPAFLWLEYNKSNFKNSYFDIEDKINYASYILNYLFSWAPEKFLGNLVDNQGNVVFTLNGIKKIANLKKITEYFLIYSIIAFLMITLIIIYLSINKPNFIKLGLFFGSIISLILEIFFICFIYIKQNILSVFNICADEICLKLFPKEFWVDSLKMFFILITVISILTLFFCNPFSKNKHIN